MPPLSLNPKRIQSSRTRITRRRLAKSQFDYIYRKVPKLLRQMREDAGLTQRELAKKIRKSQPWVFKSEASSRRVDVAEFLEWTVGCGVEPLEAFKQLVKMRGG
jgi:ribosome-binding protein aMBF1 (putative translation factor)